MSPSPLNQLAALTQSLISLSAFLIHFKPTHPDYKNQIKQLRDVKQQIVAFDPMLIAEQGDPQQRRDIYQRHINAGGTLRDVADDLGLAYTTVHSYAKRYFPSLIEHSRTNSRRLASKRLSDRLRGEI